MVCWGLSLHFIAQPLQTWFQWSLPRLHGKKTLKPPPKLVISLSPICLSYLLLTLLPLSWPKYTTTLLFVFPYYLGKSPKYFTLLDNPCLTCYPCNSPHQVSETLIKKQNRTKKHKNSHKFLNFKYSPHFSMFLFTFFCSKLSNLVYFPSNSYFSLSNIIYIGFRLLFSGFIYSPNIFLVQPFLILISPLTCNSY